MNFAALKRLLVYSFACSAFCRSWNEGGREGGRGKRIEFINEINRYPLTTGMYELGKNLWEARVQKVEIFPSNIDFEGKK